MSGRKRGVAARRARSVLSRPLGILDVFWLFIRGWGWEGLRRFWGMDSPLPASGSEVDETEHRAEPSP
jgi:hypothetical protein